MTRRLGQREHRHMVGGLFTFALFGMFVVLSLVLVAIGVDGYRAVVDNNDAVNELRTTLGYLESKINGGAGVDGILLGDYCGVQALTLVQHNEDGERQETVIYQQDGALWELFFNAEEMEFDPECGNWLIAVEALEMAAVQSNLLRFTATAGDGRTQTLHVALRAGQEVELR